MKKILLAIILANLFGCVNMVSHFFIAQKTCIAQCDSTPKECDCTLFERKRLNK